VGDATVAGGAGDHGGGDPTVDAGDGGPPPGAGDTGGDGPTLRTGEAGGLDASATGEQARAQSRWTSQRLRAALHAPCNDRRYH
jgi:hypothetical protein